MSDPAPAPSLDLESVLAEARRRSGLDDFGDPTALEALGQLLPALEGEARLNEIGRITQFERVVGILVNRARTEDWIRRHPEILEERIEAPFFIIGLPRTGTTMLHRTVSADPRNFALLWYESRNPAPFPDSESADEDSRIADAEREVEMMLEASPDLIAIHPMDAHAPDEEIMLLEFSGYSGNPEAFCEVPSYARWLETRDVTPAYRYLDRLLRFLQWQKKRAGSRADRWALKAPDHLRNLDVLFATFPDAKVILTHRDPIETIPSFASMIHTIRVGGTDHADPIGIGKHWGDRMKRALDRMMEVRADHEERFLDVDYRELVAEPMAQIARIYDFVGRTLTDEARASMQEWAVENARDKRPVHEYTLEQFGFTRDGLERDFAAYRERFIR